MSLKTTSHYRLPDHVRYKGRVKPAVKNQVPYLSQPANTQENDIKDDDYIHHANMRIYDFAITSLALHSLAIRSDNSERKVALKIANTYLQYGKGTLELPACHHNIGPGYADSLQELMTNEMIQEKTTSPKKAEVLSAKGFTEEDFDYLQSVNYNANAVRSIMRRVWPKNGNASSVLIGTVIDATLSGTDMLPRDLNLKCDKYLEISLRAKTEDLYHRLLHNEATIQESVQEFVSNVKQFFRETREGLEQSQQSLRNLKAAFEELEKDPKNKQHFILAKGNFQIIADWHKERIKTKIKAREEKLPRPSIANIPRMSITTTGAICFNSELPSAAQVSKCIGELERNIQHFENLIRFSRLQEEGSSMPNLDRLYDIPNVIENDEREKRLREAQLRMLSPNKRNDEVAHHPETKVIKKKKLFE